MKKAIALLLSFSILLTACGKEEKEKKTTQKTTTTTVTTTEATTTTATPEPEIPEIEYTLLDNKKAINDEGNLFDCEVEVFDEFTNPYIYFYKDYIVVFESVYDQDEGTEAPQIALVSIVDGELIAKKKFEKYGFCEMVVGTDNLALHSYDDKKLYIFDDNLEVIEEYNLGDADDGLIVFVDSLKEAYSFAYDKGILKLDFKNDKEEYMVESTSLYVDTVNNDYCFYSYTNTDNYMNEHYYLDCVTNSITKAPVEDFNYLNKSGNLMVYSRGDDSTIYVNHNGEEKVILDIVSYVRTVVNAEKIILSQNDLEDNSYLSMYEPDGTFISKFKDNIDVYYTTDYIYYSEEYDGYFFTLNSDKGSSLIFWDTKVEVDGDDLMVSEVYEEEEYVAEVSAEIREKVNDMEKKYGVDIKIKEECDLGAAGYDFEYLLDEDILLYNIEMLNSCMSKYPEGFFQQIKYGNIENIEIQLLSDLISPEGITMDSAAFVYENPDTIGVYFGAGRIMEYEVYHEFTHVIDFYLKFKDNANDDFLYDENKWMSFNPEGYKYAESGNDSDIEYLYNEYYIEGYFAEPYGCANSMEDRATLMAAAMTKNPTATEGRPLIEKLRFWSECIRDGFDTTGWDDVLLWEEVLD